jgi:hypothetical protein
LTRHPGGRDVSAETRKRGKVVTRGRVGLQDPGKDIIQTSAMVALMSLLSWMIEFYFLFLEKKKAGRQASEEKNEIFRSHK